MQTRLDQATRLIELERAQIGHEIHDSLLPLIFAASAGVGAIADAAGDDSLATSDQQQRLAQIASWLDEAMQAGRRLLTEIYPPELVDANWSMVAAAAVERLFPDRGSLVRWEMEPGVDEVADPLAVAAYRIVVEAVRNSLRHGNAQQVAVRATRLADRWQITVTDDGDGFEPSEIPSDRFGIRSMIGRAELAGGTLKVASQRGGPTTVTFCFPE